jgi:hypothetical protein
MLKGKRKARSPRGERGSESRTTAMARRVNTTLGELIAAAFDTAGSEVKAVAELVSCSAMARLIGRRIVLI